MFSIYEEFVEFIVNDISYYKYENFLIAVKIKNYFNKVDLSFDEYEKFNDLVNNKLKITQEIEDINKKIKNYDDAPEEFIDKLTCEIMEDPVTLPTSNINLDRETIEYHLLKNPIDPYNRKPLTKEQLIPNIELKKELMNIRKIK